MLPHPGQQPPLHLGRGYKRYAAGHCRRRKQLWDCRQLHLPGRLGCSTCQVQEGVEGIARLGSRAAATVAIRRAASCAVVPPGRFTLGTDELCSSRRLASRRVCCARLYDTPGRVCTPASAKWGVGGAPLQAVPHTQSRTLCLPPGELAKLCQAGWRLEYASRGLCRLFHRRVCAQRGARELASKGECHQHTCRAQVNALVRVHLERARSSQRRVALHQCWRSRRLWRAEKAAVGRSVIQ